MECPKCQAKPQYVQEERRYVHRGIALIEYSCRACGYGWSMFEKAAGRA